MNIIPNKMYPLSSPQQASWGDGHLLTTDASNETLTARFPEPINADASIPKKTWFPHPQTLNKPPASLSRPTSTGPNYLITRPISISRPGMAVDGQ